MKTLLVAQSGGPTAVINASLAGVIGRAKENGFRVLGLKHGLEGALRDEIVDLSRLSPEDLAKLRGTPGALLGGSRHPLENEDYLRVLDLFRREKADVFLFIGGNGTMSTCHTLLRLAAERGEKGLVVNGVPKTVDNDLVGMDHAPGYLSCARFVALSAKAQGADLRCMCRFEQVRVLEVMGRSVGWLAAASALGQEYEGEAPHLVYAPEWPLDPDAFLSDVQDVYRRHGYAVAVVGEGMTRPDGSPLGREQYNQGGGPRPVIVGASSYLADLVNEKLSLKAKAQNMSMVQRAFSECRCVLDEQEAFDAGVAAVDGSLAGVSGKMIWKGGSLPLEEVSGKERRLPAEYYDPATRQPSKAFRDWLAPLLGPMPSYYTL